jgi:hypothetical protein
MLALRDRPVERLVDGTVMFFAKYAALVVLAAAGLAFRRGRRGDISPFLLLSLLLGGLVVVLQLWSSYHLYVMAAPLAALAVLGVDSLLDSRMRRTIIAVVVVVAIATVPAVILGARKAERLVGLATGESLVEYRSFSANYILALAESDAIGVSVGDSIYVLGNPLTMQIPGADQAIPINGWSPEFWTEDIWRRAADQLATSDVDALFIRDEVALLSEERAPWFLPEISEGYDLVVEIDSGSWYAPTK